MNDASKAAEFEEKAAAWEKRATDAASAARSSHDPKIAAEFRCLASRYSSLGETSRKIAAYFKERAHKERSNA
jgi:hypothetical protein